MSSSHKLVIKDALWQLFWRIVSALFWFVITKIISSYLGPLRYGDYWTIFRFFAWWTALVDFWIYVIAVKQLWEIKNRTYWEWTEIPPLDPNSELSQTYGKFVGMRIFLIIVIYTIAIVTAYLIPAYTSNPFIVWWLPLAMCYSASNMYAGIQQLPLQIFWKMKRLTWSLIIARFSQLFVLLPVVFIFFSNIDFQEAGWETPIMILAFCLVVFSVVASSLWQNVEMHLRTKDLLPLKIRINMPFIKDLLKKNRKYWFSYFFSSFHTLLVLMFLWWFFPTASWYKYAGIWALALSLIEILLIIPSSLGNSLLHKIPHYSDENKKKSLWNLMLLVGWLWAIIAINFWVFAEDIIIFVSSKAFLWSRDSIAMWWSNQVLPFLWIVLVLSFIKQVYNYLFVALEKQNILFWINLTWVVLWALAWIFLIPKYWLLWWVITQVFIETLFTLWAIRLWVKRWLTPIFQKKVFLELVAILWLFTLIWYFVRNYMVWSFESTSFTFWSWTIAANVREIIRFFIIAIFYNLVLLWISIPSIKKVAKWLTND